MACAIRLPATRCQRIGQPTSPSVTTDKATGASLRIWPNQWPGCNSKDPARTDRVSDEEPTYAACVTANPLDELQTHGHRPVADEPEAFNERCRKECLRGHWFMTVADALKRWQLGAIITTRKRPHGAIGQEPLTWLQMLGAITSPPSRSSPQNTTFGRYEDCTGSKQRIDRRYPRKKNRERIGSFIEEAPAVPPAATGTSSCAAAPQDPSGAERQALAGLARSPCNSA